MTSALGQNAGKKNVPTPKRLGCIAFTENGLTLARRIADELSLTDMGFPEWVCDVAQGFGPWRMMLAPWAAEHFAGDDALIVVGSCGIAVRAIAPHVTSKTSDPAVIVVDEGGHWCIPLLSGHIGGANRLARRVSQMIGAQCVLTTATDSRGMWSVDTWACDHGLLIDDASAVRLVSGKMLAGRTVRLYSDVPLADEPPEGLELTDDVASADVVLSPWRLRAASPDALWLIPRCLSVGLGCRRGKGEGAIQTAWKKTCASLSRTGRGVDERAVATVRSIDLKANELGLLAFCRNHGWELETFSTQELAQVEGCVSEPSELVERVTGVDNVCERAALLGGGTVVWPKHAYDGVTVSVVVRAEPISFKTDQQ
ncbi:cobalt-precorrin 5A hydrolase [Paratractidigestivibacter sp.]|uniref:cobalt-precorrin 5A hydrolase n=1 Tax=Paratractidigestivibacter sp. TaxID=2847316 RepID=UPI002ABD4AF9|nr:cobalamin biosynthesis protein [Paratractidigestivibacter sp.]